jgi:flavin-binding protein dodecin
MGDRLAWVSHRDGMCGGAARDGGHLNETESIGGKTMSEGIFKVIELVGTSDESISKAISAAITKAGSTLRHMGWFEVTQIRGHINGGDVDSYQVTLKAGFKLDD